MENVIDKFMSTEFAACVACFVLFRLERELKELRRSIERLARCEVCIVEGKPEEEGKHS